ncbi:hypothetical protein F5Y06DRAFT_279804 [Hypoxylon sp. FL0890]|nr:hypothetical protein F5Y06DRAFT_279804 [Hypoxylon sp. FL0890]
MMPSAPSSHRFFSTTPGLDHSCSGRSANNKFLSPLAGLMADALPPCFLSVIPVPLGTKSRYPFVTRGGKRPVQDQRRPLSPL